MFLKPNKTGRFDWLNRELALSLNCLTTVSSRFERFKVVEPWFGGLLGSVPVLVFETLVLSDSTSIMRVFLFFLTKYHAFLWTWKFWKTCRDWHRANWFWHLLHVSWHNSFLWPWFACSRKCELCFYNLNLFYIFL